MGARLLTRPACAATRHHKPSPVRSIPVGPNCERAIAFTGIIGIDASMCRRGRRGARGHVAPAAGVAGAGRASASPCRLVASPCRVACSRWPRCERAAARVEPEAAIGEAGVARVRARCRGGSARGGIGARPFLSRGGWTREPDRLNKGTGRAVCAAGRGGCPSCTFRGDSTPPRRQAAFRAATTAIGTIGAASNRRTPSKQPGRASE